MVDQPAARSEHAKVPEYLGAAVVDQRRRQVDQMHHRLLGSIPLREIRARQTQKITSWRSSPPLNTERTKFKDHPPSRLRQLDQHGVRVRASMLSQVSGSIPSPTGSSRRGRDERKFIFAAFEPILAELQPLIDKVWRHYKGMRGRTVTLKVTFADFELISRSRTVVGSRSEFENVSAELLKALSPCKKPSGCSAFRYPDSNSTKFGALGRKP